MRPLNILESETFKELIKTLEPRLTIPTRKTMRKVEIPKLYEKFKNFLITETKALEAFTLTFDLWTDINLVPYITLTIHYINCSDIICDFVCLIKNRFQDPHRRMMKFLYMKKKIKYPKL